MNKEKEKKQNLVGACVGLDDILKEEDSFRQYFLMDTFREGRGPFCPCHRVHWVPAHWALESQGFPKDGNHFRHGPNQEFTININPIRMTNFSRHIFKETRVLPSVRCRHARDVDVRCDNVVGHKLVHCKPLTRRQGKAVQWPRDHREGPSTDAKNTS